jgi:thiosulfate/3-mercaptopyruvate sulfurtransferase
MTNYVHPEILVETDWVVENLKNPAVRLIEVNDDMSLYETGHIPGAASLNWRVDMLDPVSKEFVGQQQFEQLLGYLGIYEDSQVILYGDSNNWYAATAYWLFTLYGHKDVKIIKGGRARWMTLGHPYTKHIPSFASTTYHACPPKNSIRLLGLKHLQADPQRAMVMAL